MLHTTRSPGCRAWLGCAGLLAGLLGTAPAAAQTTVTVPLTRQAAFTGTLFTRRDTTQRLRHVPNSLRRYLLKYVVLGGGPGQPPAQRLNVLIGRDAQERIVFVPAAPQTFRFRAKDQQVLALAEAHGQPFGVTLRGPRGPVVVRLRPSFRHENFQYFSPQEQHLFLTLERPLGYEARLTVAGKTLALQVVMHGQQEDVLLTDSTAAVQVTDSQQEDHFYKMGQSLLAGGQLLTPLHISAGGDSLTVRVAEAPQAAQAFGAAPGLAFRPTTLLDLRGQPVALAGRERPLVLDFWGTWCPPCVALTPRLKALHQQYTGKIDLVGIALDEAANVRQYLASNAMTWPNIAIPAKESANSLIEKMGVDSYPTFILVHKGVIVYRGVGEAGLQEITQRLAHLI
jgi:thiol-disulfide isomerase/thioredoxin